MKGPHPLAVVAILLPLLVLGWLLWRDQGAMVWLSGFIAYCF
ncbi:hypothetical protein [Sphingomonas cavernae]|nr:hypothetical protein [Sphingomonas cavernae]